MNLYAVCLGKLIVGAFYAESVARVYFTIIQQELNVMPEMLEMLGDSKLKLEPMQDSPELRVLLPIALVLNDRLISRHRNPNDAKTFRGVYRLLMLKRLDESLRFVDTSNVN